MNAQSFERRFWLILAFLGGLLGLVILAGSLIGLSSPRLVPANGIVGARGPVTLAFPTSMNIDSVEHSLAFDPPLAGRFTWAGLDGRPDRVISFWPGQPLQPGQVLTLRLAPGALNQAGLALRRGLSWQVHVRSPAIIYLSPVDAPDLWLVSPDGGAPLRLTHTGGSVFDFSISPDGEKIVYSAYNKHSGVDLWEVGRDGEEPNLLLPCQSDWCVNPAYSADGQTIAYSRRQAGSAEGEGPGIPHIWLFDRSVGTTDILYSNPNISGHAPAWSPDGRFLAFFDGLSGGIRVLELSTGADFLLPSQSGVTGEWSPDSRSLVFTDYHSTDTGPYVAVYLADVQSRQVSRILADGLDQFDYSNPVWSADGKQLVAALRLMSGSPTRQLWLFTFTSAVGSGAVDRRAITDEQLYTYASYHWDPTGENLVYQRLELGTSDKKPQVGVWNRARQETLLLAEDAFQPQWAP